MPTSNGCTTTARTAACPAARATHTSGCWADRQIVLGRFGSRHLVMGAAYDPTGDTSSEDRGGSSLAATLAASTQAGRLRLHLEAGPGVHVRRAAAAHCGRSPPRSPTPGSAIPRHNVAPVPDYTRVCVAGGIDNSPACLDAVLARHQPRPRARRHPPHGAAGGLRPAEHPRPALRRRQPREGRPRAPGLRRPHRPRSTAMRSGAQTTPTTRPTRARPTTSTTPSGPADRRTGSTPSTAGCTTTASTAATSTACTGAPPAAGATARASSTTSVPGPTWSWARPSTSTGDTHSGDKGGTSMAVTLAVAGAPAHAFTYSWAAGRLATLPACERPERRTVGWPRCATAQLYINPSCSKCRTALALLDGATTCRRTRSATSTSPRRVADLKGLMQLLAIDDPAPDDAHRRVRLCRDWHWRTSEGDALLEAISRAPDSVGAAHLRRRRPGRHRPPAREAARAPLTIPGSAAAAPVRVVHAARRARNGGRQ